MYFGRFDHPLLTTKVGQSCNLPQMLGFVKIATISCYQHRAWYGECRGVVERVKQVMLKLASQFNGFGVGHRRRYPRNVKLGQIIYVLLCTIWF